MLVLEITIEQIMYIPQQNLETRILLYPYWTLLNFWHLVVAWLNDHMVHRNLPVAFIS